MLRASQGIASVFASVWMLTLASGAVGQVTYTVDSSSSYLEIVDVSGADVSDQFAGSDILTFSGTVDVDLSGGTIEFTSAAIDAIAQSGIAPQAGGVAGTEDGDAGLDVSIDIIFDDLEGPVALRNVVVDAYSDPITVSGGGGFDATAVTFELSDGDVDYRLESGFFDLIGGDPIDGASGDNEAAVGVVLSGGATIVVPVELSLSFEVEGIPITVELSGGLVLEEP